MFSKVIRNKGICNFFFSTLVLAEHHNSKLLLSTSKMLNAASQLKQNVDVFVAGDKLEKVIEQLKTGFSNKIIKKIIVAQHPSISHSFSDALELILKQLIEQNKYTHILTSSSSMGKDLIPRIASRFDCQAISDILSIQSQEQFTRGIYASNAITTVKSLDKIKFMSCRSTNFDLVKVDAKSNVEAVENLNVEQILNSADNKDRLVKHVKDELSTSDKPELSSAKIVLAGGRGLKSKENFVLLDQLAEAIDKKNTAIGASRAAVDAGYVPNDLQIGQTGQVVAPELYFAIGVSGAIQHVAGMKDSKVIVSINKDAEAPIFQISNYGLVGDLFKVIPELIEKLKKA